MKVTKAMYYTLLIFATIIKFILAFGIPFCIIGIGSMIGLWQFTWGGVLVVYILYMQLRETKMSMDLLGIAADDEDEGDE